MKSRPVQYLGLLLLILASIAVIYLPFGSAPDAQPFSVSVSAPQPFSQLVAKGKNVSDEADAAFDKEFPSSQNETLPEAFSLSRDGKTATVQARAATREEAKTRANRIVKALATKFKGVKLAELKADDLPTAPLFSLGNLAVYPPQKRDGQPVPAVKLGLDLQGGVNLVLQVRRALFPYTVQNPPTTPATRSALLDDVREALSRSDAGGTLRGADVAWNPDINSILEIRTQAQSEAEFNAQKAAIDAALKTVNGLTLGASRPAIYYPKSTESGENVDVATTRRETLNSTAETLRARVDGLGVSEPLIQTQLPDRIIVQLPGVDDPQKAVDKIGRTAQMEIRLLPENLQPRQDPTDPNRTVFVTNEGQPVDAATARQQSELIVSGGDVKPTTQAGFVGNREPAIFFELQGEGSRRFAEVTRRVAGQNRFIPIFLDERCISAPTVREPITGGSGQISGGFANLQEARDLAVLLNSGALPAPIDVVENRTVSATLGNDSLQKSLRAGLYGLLVVMAFMIAVYRVPGVVANLALVIYSLLNLAVFVLVGGTLTLPGIAGFLLAMAMSLDTNVLVFERLKEEMAIQPTFTAALRAAFTRAWTAILDSHVTTLIAALVLFYFGTGPVKGFALTLGIGVVLSLFSAIVVTRLFMWSVVRLGEKNPSLFAGKLPSRDAILAQRGS